MKTQIATTKEQSTRLLSCGVDPKTADLVWLDDGNNRSRLTIYTPIISDRYKIVKAWSLSKLLELLPPQIKPSWPEFDFCLQFRRNEKGKWEIAYDHILEADSPIEACVRMIETLTNNKHPLNKIEE